MAEMSMNKAIHGAFRRDLDRFVAALSAFPPGDRGRAAALEAAWQNFDAQLTRHHEGEHDIAWPALQKVGVSPQLLATMDAEHGTMADALSGARAAMGRLAGSPGADEAAAALAAIRDLREATISHLDHEEAEIEEVYLTKRATPRR